MATSQSRLREAHGPTLRLVLFAFDVGGHLSTHDAPLDDKRFTSTQDSAS